MFTGIDSIVAGCVVGWLIASAGFLVMWSNFILKGPKPLGPIVAIAGFIGGVFLISWICGKTNDFAYISYAITFFVVMVWHFWLYRSTP